MGNGLEEFKILRSCNDERSCLTVGVNPDQLHDLLPSINWIRKGNIISRNLLKPIEIYKIVKQQIEKYKYQINNN